MEISEAVIGMCDVVDLATGRKPRASWPGFFVTMLIIGVVTTVVLLAGH